MKFKTRKKVANVLSIVSGFSLGVFGVGLGDLAGALYVNGTPMDKPVGRCLFRLLGTVGGTLVVLPIAQKIDEKLNEWVYENWHVEYLAELSLPNEDLEVAQEETEAE